MLIFLLCWFRLAFLSSTNSILLKSLYWVILFDMLSHLSVTFPFDWISIRHCLLILSILDYFQLLSQVHFSLCCVQISLTRSVNYFANFHQPKLLLSFSIFGIKENFLFDFRRVRKIHGCYYDTQKVRVTFHSHLSHAGRYPANISCFPRRLQRNNLLCSKIPWRGFRDVFKTS